MSSELKKSPEDIEPQAVDSLQASDEYYEEDDYDVADESAYHEYRSLSIAAVASLIFGVLSILLIPIIIIASALLIVPMLGVFLGLFATWTISSRPDEFTGKRLAITGIALSGVMFLAGAVLNYQLNKIEVPPEYVGKEVPFVELQATEDIDLNFVMQMRNRYFELPIPERAKELDGQKVFITGYGYPGDQKNGLDKFVLVPDMGQCCFGGQPKLTDMIEVKLKEPLRVDYSMWRRGVGGTLRVHPAIQAREQLTGVIYQLEADYLSEGPGVTGSAG